MMNGKVIRGWVAGALVALTAGVCPSLGQNVPIMVAVTNTVTDQWERHLNRGDYVQILFVNDGIYPPNPDGSPHPSNTISYLCRIGEGMIAHTTTVGKFNAAITERSEAPIFARVWNTPTLANPSYYADSQVFTPQQGKVFYPEFGAMIAMDPADDDNDGLNNSDEADLGSNPNSIDSDGDGIFDFAEFRSGTDLTNDQSYLSMVDIHADSLGDDVMMIQWSSEPGYAYQLQYAVEDLDATNLVFVDVNDVVTATGAVSYTFVTNDLLETIKSFRVLLVEQPPVTDAG